MESTKPEPETNCRHEFVRIYQRKLKGLERRLVATRAYLPVGFKMADFAHLSEGYCFCTKCRTRLYPRRTAAEKAQARLAARAAQDNQAAQAEIAAEPAASVQPAGRSPASSPVESIAASKGETAAASAMASRRAAAVGTTSHDEMSEDEMDEDEMDEDETGEEETDEDDMPDDVLDSDSAGSEASDENEESSSSISVDELEVVALELEDLGDSKVDMTPDEEEDEP